MGDARVIDFRCMIEVGDLVFIDMDGVPIVPREVEREAITLALEKARGEKVVRRDIEAGASSTEACARYGVL